MGKGKTPRGSRRKTTKGHSTAIPMVEKLLQVLNRHLSVEKIALGVIKPGLRAGHRRIKIMTENDKVLLLKVRDVNTLQEVWVYNSSATETRELLVSYAEKSGWGVT